MKNTTKNYQLEENSHLIVLKKFINQLLFGKMFDPKFSTEIEYIKISRKYIGFIKALRSEEYANKDLKISNFFDSVIEVFGTKMTNKDKRNLLCCYFESNLKITKDVAKMLSFKDEQSDFDEKDLEFEMIAEFLNCNKISKDLANYLRAQFHDILQYFHPERETICNEEYVAITEKYVRNYEYEEILSMISNEFEKAD